VAASLLLISALAALLISQQLSKNKTEPIVYKTFTTGRGQKASITLTDGTIVVLNSESSLRYPEHFTDTSRVLYLKGEGYFRVAKDRTKPFSVYTSRTLTRVLGTVFDLKAYDHEATTLVVEEGRVRFGNLKNLPQTIYTAGKWSQFDLSGASDVKTINAADYTAWKENKLVFTGQTLAQIIPVLQRWYNVDIKINNAALSAQHFTGEFDNVPVSFLLDRMSFVMKFHYSLNQQTIIIK
jgi:transmembrane sensor